MNMCFQVLFRVNKSSGSKFQTIGSETKKARLPDMLHWTSGRDSWWRLADRRCWWPRYFRHRHIFEPVAEETIDRHGKLVLLNPEYIATSHMASW